MKKLTATLILAASALAMQAAIPEGWFLAGSKPAEYDCTIDPSATYNGQFSTYLRSKEGITTTGFGTMMQSFSAEPYLGKRVRLSGNLKSEGVTEWGGLWMRVDDANHPKNGYPAMVAFDNMHDGPSDRSIKGTTAWKSYSVVLDVPEEATGISLGFLLGGRGTLWVNGMKVEIVGKDVSVTGIDPSKNTLPSGPVNLDFTK